MTDFAESQLTVPAEGFNTSDPGLYANGAICGKEKFTCLKSHINYDSISGTNITDRITGLVFNASAAGLTTFPSSKEFQLALSGFVATGPVLNIVAPPPGVSKHIYCVIVGQTQNNGTNDAMNVTFDEATTTLAKVQCLNNSAGVENNFHVDTGITYATPANAAATAATPYFAYTRNQIYSTGVSNDAIRMTRKLLSTGATETQVNNSGVSVQSTGVTTANRILLRGRLLGTAVFAFQATSTDDRLFIEKNLFLMAKQWQAGNINFIPPEFRDMTG